MSGDEARVFSIISLIARSALRLRSSLSFVTPLSAMLQNYVVKSEPLSSPSRALRDGFAPVPLQRYDSSEREIKMIEPEELSEYDSSQETDISQTTVQSVHAEVVRMHQADAETITADQVELTQSAAANVKANQISAHQSALAMVNAAEVISQNGATGFVQAEKASVGGFTGAVLAGSAEIRNGVTGFVIGQDVQMSEGRTIFLVSRNVYGNVTTLMDSRSALLAGLVGGLFSGLMLLLGRMLVRRR